VSCVRNRCTGISLVMGEGLEWAIEAGKLLRQVKKQLPHGEWLPWLRDNFRGSEMTAQRYVRLSLHEKDLQRNPTRVLDLTLRGALKLIKQHKARQPSPSPAVATNQVDDLAALSGQKFGTIYADPPWA
jgi:hypothetical protein